ncbi:large ribosomal subunit protein uL10m-like [Styela clava]|uniref:39S ribosomal protein L10, mitochondrial-like n=1 Tax=Styela clava TaxID=7725 RepID=UPI001939F51A|nr:39S ribosomal protein L10, mitochondrial-like [Styela clava]
MLLNRLTFLFSAEHLIFNVLCRMRMALCAVLKSFTSSKVILPFTIIKRYRYYWEARPENKWRKKMMMITLPRFGRSDYEPEEQHKEDDRLHGLDVVLHQEATEAMNKSKMIVVFLQAQMEITEFYRMRHELKKINIFLDEFPNHVMQHVLKNTRLENLLSLYQGRTLTVYSEGTNIIDLLKISNKNPYVALLGGIIDDHAMSARQMIDYSKLPPIDNLHSQLSFILTSHSSSTHNLLQRNQTETASLLSQYIQDEKTDTQV